MAHTCSACNSKRLQWKTVRERVPVDVLFCISCEAVHTQDDWDAPLAPLNPNRCLNCGGTFEDKTCASCSLSYDESLQVHDELRDLINPDLGHLDAARQAAREGRQLLALKLATSASLFDKPSRAVRARAIRIHLLSTIDGPQTARDDARDWTQKGKDVPAIAWALYGKQLDACKATGAALEAYERSLAIDPNQISVRIRKAELLVLVGREGQAAKEIQTLLKKNKEERHIKRALPLIEQLVCFHADALRDDQVLALLGDVASVVDRSPTLLIHRARIAALDGESSAAKRDIKAARKLDPNRPEYVKVEQLLKSERSSWWQW